MTKDKVKPEITFLVGVNGAGKSTLRNSKLSELTNVVIIDPDQQARKYLDQGVNTRIANIKAGRDVIQIFNDSIENKKDIFLESTLSGQSIFKRYQTALDNNYKVNTLYVGLESLEIHKARVAMRVSMGGHDIPNDLIEKRYNNTASNLKKAINLSSETLVYDNTYEKTELAFEIKDKKLMIHNQFDWTDKFINELKKENTIDVLPLHNLDKLRATLDSYKDQIGLKEQKAIHALHKGLEIAHKDQPDVLNHKLGMLADKVKEIAEGKHTTSVDLTVNVTPEVDVSKSKQSDKDRSK